MTSSDIRPALAPDGLVHFHSGDERFCGSTVPCREFTTDPNAVTCQACMDRDGFVLSPDAAEYVRSLNARLTA